MSSKNECPPPGSPAWMATFSDLMTQLLVFFIFLFTMSVLDVEKAKAALLSFNQSFGGIMKNNPSVIKSDTIIIPYPETTIDPKFGRSGDDLSKMQLENTLHKVIFWVKSNELEIDISSSFDSDGNIKIQLKDSLFFDLGESTLKPEAVPIIHKLGELLKNFDNKIVTEGHTDNIPIVRGPYKSNWELSTARALTVTKYFIEKSKIPPKRLSLSGYGEYQPLTTNATILGRAKNRRVTIIIVKKKESELY